MSHSEQQTGSFEGAEYRPMADITRPQQARAVAEPGSTMIQPSRSDRRAYWKYTVVGLVAIAFLATAAICWHRAHRPVVVFDENKNVNHNEYQAVFLTNGQVYFGKLDNLSHKYVIINDIFYLQVQQSQSLQQGTGGDSNSQISLAKLGSELHGPEDKMYIASDQVLFWENLKPDSKVVQAINKYQNR